MSSKTHFTVVRNQGYTATEFNTRERHNERKNEYYGNGDIVKERSELNIHFKRILSPDGTPETYEETFNKLIKDGTIVKRGLKPDAKVFAELIFDVNTAYFEENGGYEYAKEFYKTAYDMAVKEVGDERFILSAVMHADEKNAALSEKLGYDVFHLHLHVVYIPIVEKKCYYRKDMKDKSKAGKLKEVINQISHSKKWPIKVPVEKNGKSYFVNSYSLLQDRYFEHMKAAGFGGFERGERGSTAEHLDVLDYKIKQDTIRAEEIKSGIAELEEDLGELDKEAEIKEAKLEKIDKAIKVKESAKATQNEIGNMGHALPLVPGMHFTDEEAKKLKTLAKKSVTADGRVATANKKMATLEGQLDDMKKQLQEAKAEVNQWRNKYLNLLNEFKDFFRLLRKFPARVKEFFAGLTREEQAQERQLEQERQAERLLRKTKSRGMEI